MKKKRITVLGSTGTIGCNTLDIVSRNPELFEIHALSANNNIEKLKHQIRQFHPEVVVLCNEEAAEKAHDEFKNEVKVLTGVEGLKEISGSPSVDFVMAGIVGAAGLDPFISALESGKQIGLANKEVLVMAGEYLHNHYPGFRDQIIPVDSEHSAIFQCLKGNSVRTIESILLTASGGPFRTRTDFNGLTVEEALNHPNWKMGAKISIDSATMMNKGLELIEAYWLFPVSINQIRILIHPQSVIHSMVLFCDGSIIAHLGTADMRIPIQYALSYPERIKNDLTRLNFAELKSLTFDAPDFERFPCLRLAYEVLEKKNIFPTVLNAANEIAVKYFLNNKLDFQDISRCIESIFRKFEAMPELNLETIKLADQQAREEAKKWILQR